MVVGTWALNCLSGASLPGRTMLEKGLPSKTSDAPHVKWEQSHSSEVTMRVRESAQKPWHMHSRLSLMALSPQRALFYSQHLLLLPGNSVSLFYI